ncbi:hypothetical protein ACB094_09G110300 [Castanea mollissima]
MILITLIHSTVQVKILHYLLSFLSAFSIKIKRAKSSDIKGKKIWKKKTSRNKNKSKKGVEGHTCLGWRRKKKKRENKRENVDKEEGKKERHTWFSAGEDKKKN